MALPAIGAVRQHLPGDHARSWPRARPCRRSSTWSRASTRCSALPAVAGAAGSRRRWPRPRACRPRHPAAQLVPERVGGAAGGHPRAVGLRGRPARPPADARGAASRAARLHQADYYTRLAAALGFRAVGAPAALRRAGRRASARARRCWRSTACSRGVPLVGMAPGAAYGQAKQWPPRALRPSWPRLLRERHGASRCSSAAGARPRRGARDRPCLPPDAADVVDLVGRDRPADARRR